MQRLFYKPEDAFAADFIPFWHDGKFRNESAGEYNMLIVCRKKDSGYTGGFTALYASDDLVKWTDRGDFWAPGLYHTHECPDFFRIGDWWYLVYSEYSDKFVTRYVMSRDWNGPWTIPADDMFDGRAFYAAKSAFDGDRRYLFGWIPTKAGNDDNNPWQWGGNLAVHEVFARGDGTLAVRLPESIDRAWRMLEMQPLPVRIANASGKAEHLAFTAAEGTWRVDAELRFGEGMRHFGIALGLDFKSKHGYKYEFTVGGELTIESAAIKNLEP